MLDARATHPNASLAELFDPLTMPANLVKAYQALDKAVDAAYGCKGANIDAARVAFLFECYQQLISLLPTEKAKKPLKRTPALRADTPAHLLSNSFHDFDSPCIHAARRA